MSSNKILLSGSDTVFELITAWLNTPDERKLVQGLGKKQRVVTVVPRERTEIPMRAVDSLNKIIEMYETLGYPTDEVKKIVDPKIEGVLDIFGKLERLKRLKTKGVVKSVFVHSAQEKERRRADRYETWTKLAYRNEENWYRGHVCDISKTGAQILAWHNWSPNEIAEIKLQDFDRSEEVKILGRVVWWRDAKMEQNDHGYTCRFGLRFADKLPAEPTSFIPRGLRH